MTFLQNNRKPDKKSWKFDNYSHFFIVTHYTAMHISGLFSTPWYHRLATRHVVTSRRFRERIWFSWQIHTWRIPRTVLNLWSPALRVLPGWKPPKAGFLLTWLIFDKHHSYSRSFLLHSVWHFVSGSDARKKTKGIKGVPHSIEPRHEKTCFCPMRTTKAQISLRIRAVWIAPLLFAP